MVFTPLIIRIVDGTGRTLAEGMELLSGIMVVIGLHSVLTLTFWVDIVLENRGGQVS
jgi:hypothetical protein